ncbi:hypothetical protein Taro_020153 [Colocasia esculenta]|uniref:Uncharacterized protein n=1 Tax=Colocasia esculenta TaxID=4460 RepID=A0A843V4D5_COLES|nr:hypothetical protein [Colocasia esculenta]
MNFEGLDPTKWSIFRRSSSTRRDPCHQATHPRLWCAARIITEVGVEHMASRGRRGGVPAREGEQRREEQTE